MARVARPQLETAPSDAFRLVEPRLTLLGGFSLSYGDGAAPVPSGVERLIAYVALAERPVPRSRAAAALWLDGSDARAGANLRSAIWRIRRHAPWLLADGPGLRLARGVEADVVEARNLASRLREGRWLGEADVDTAPFLADLLPDWYDDWVILERERYRQVRLHALEALSGLLVEHERYAEAIDVALAAVAGEPLRESAHRALIHAHLAEGNLSEALRHHRSYRQLLRDELDVEPSEDLERLIRSELRSERASHRRSDVVVTPR